MVITVLKQTVSNTFEKAANTIRVTSLLFMGLSSSSLIPKSTVEVERPLLKPLQMVSPRRDSLAQKSVIWKATSFSSTLDSTGRIDTGRKWSSVMDVSTFGMGLIRASFQARGKYNFDWIHAVIDDSCEWTSQVFSNQLYKLGRQQVGSSRTISAQLFKGSQDFSLCNTFQVKGALFIRKTANKLEEFILVGRFNIKRSPCGEPCARIL